MFWGLVLKPGASHTLKEEDGALLHLSAACLHEPKDAGRCALQVKTEEGSFTLAILQKDSQEMASFDLFFNTMAPPTFHNAGKNEVHLSGYFELSGDDQELDSDEEILSDEDEEVPIQGLKKKPLPEEDEEDEDEEDDEDEDDDEEELDSDDLEGLEDSDEEDEEEEESEEEVKPQPAAKNANGKRPAVVEAKTAPVSKMTKVASADPADAFAAQVKEFLKTNGKTGVGMLGAKVKKPEAVTLKLKAFLLSRKEFKVNGDNVELA